MNTVTVIISGAQGSGKTLLGEFIVEALAKKGVTAELENSDERGLTKVTINQERSPVKLAAALLGKKFRS